MVLHQLQLWFLQAILLSFCLKSGKATAYEEKDIDVPAQWNQITYINDNIAPVAQTTSHQIGIQNRQSDKKTLVATHSAGIVARGDFFTISSIELSYTFKHERRTEIMRESDIYTSRTIENTVTIPPKSTLTRWELSVDVAGTEIRYSYYIDKLNDTYSTPHDVTIRAKVRIHRRIHYGTTRIRIKHQDRQKYVTVVRKKNWPAATLGDSNRYLFVLCEGSRGIRIKTLNTTHPGYVWAYASSSDIVYFDWNRELGHSYDSNVDAQHWTISKNEPHYHGDVVTFTNKYYDDSGMYYNRDYTPNVYCDSGLEDRWILEIAETLDAKECPIDYCK